MHASQIIAKLQQLMQETNSDPLVITGNDGEYGMMVQGLELDYFLKYIEDDPEDLAYTSVEVDEPGAIQMIEIW